MDEEEGVDDPEQEEDSHLNTWHHLASLPPSCLGTRQAAASDMRSSISVGLCLPTSLVISPGLGVSDSYGHVPCQQKKYPWKNCAFN